jgi:IS30 family transposase
VKNSTLRVWVKQAGEAATERPGRDLVTEHRQLRAENRHLRLEPVWSPEQIAGWLRDTFPGDADMQVSHETIYRSPCIQSRGVLTRALLAHLRRGRRFRHSRHATTAGHARGQITDAVSIRERPPRVEDRAVPGHWEGDLIAGASNSHIATLVARQSRYLRLVRVRGKDSRDTANAVPLHCRGEGPVSGGPAVSRPRRLTQRFDAWRLCQAVRTRGVAVAGPG